MKKILRFVIFLSAFQMEVRVRASSDIWMQHPEKCLTTQEAPCSVEALGAAFHYKNKDLSLHAIKGSTLARTQSDQWRLLQGRLWVEKGENITVETVYGSVNAKQGQYWILEDKSHFILRNMNADMEITLRDGAKLSLPPGFEVWIAGINGLGKSEHGVIRPIDMSEHLPLWRSLYEGDNKKFAEEVHDLHDNWGDIVEKSSDLYQTSARRGLASAIERDQKQKELLREKAVERQRLRELFWKQSFER